MENKEIKILRILNTIEHNKNLYKNYWTNGEKGDYFIIITNKNYWTKGNVILYGDNKNINIDNNDLFIVIDEGKEISNSSDPYLLNYVNLEINENEKLFKYKIKSYNKNKILNDILFAKHFQHICTEIFYDTKETFIYKIKIFFKIYKIKRFLKKILNRYL